MPLEVRPGGSIPIPCRACGKSCAKLRAREGIQTVPCSRCGGETRVEVYAEGDRWRVKTALHLELQAAKKR